MRIKNYLKTVFNLFTASRQKAPSAALILLILFGCASGEKENSESPFISDPEITRIDTSKNFALEFSPDSTLPEDCEVGAERGDALRAAFSQQLEKISPVGLNCMLYSAHAGYWKNQVGNYDETKSLAVSADTPMPIGSIAKIFTSAIILSLVEEGKLSLTDKVSAWFPDYSFLEGVTVDHLLSHTSGIVTSEIIRRNYSEKNRYKSADECVRDVLTAYPRLLFSPGQSYHYSNTGYVMLGIIAEKVSGKTAGELYDEKIIAPLGLKHTFYAARGDNGRFLNVSFDSEGNAIAQAEHPANPHAAGALVSTPGESIKIFSAILGGKIITQESVRLMLSDMRLLESTAVCDVYYGRGIALIRIKVPGKEADYIGHKGNINCFNSVLFYRTDKNLFTEITVNTQVPSLDPMMFKLSEAY